MQQVGNGLINFSNYGVFAELVKKGKLKLNVLDINESNWDQYYNGLLNVMKDGIETEFIQSVKITIYFGDPSIHCKLTVPDLYFNLIMWHMLIRAKIAIEPKHLFFSKTITKKEIKNYIDEFFILQKRKTMDLKLMNNIIDDTLHYFADVDDFSMYLANTINLEDFISLSKASPRFNELMHADLSHVPIQNVKDVGMEMANESIEIIKNSEKLMSTEHCLANSFRAKEGISAKQYKEFAINIGAKPDGKGGVHPSIINHSYLNGGLDNFLYQFIDSSASRFAQIITKNKIGDSGNFARIVGLNSINAFLHDDPDYDCDTKNFIHLTIKSEKMLNLFVDRYYKLDPEGPDFLITRDSKELIGKPILLRSPITCASNAKGHGICFKCYGDLAYVNRNIKPGKMAAELFTSKTTQERLSSKHYLEAKVRTHDWNEAFKKYITIDGNQLTLNSNEMDEQRKYIIINPADIILENQDDYEKTDYIDDIREEDDNEATDNKKKRKRNADDEDSEEQSTYNEYVTTFYVYTEKTGEIETITSYDNTKMYISISLGNLIRTVGKPTEDYKIKLRFADIENTTMFFIKIQNNDLGKSLTDIQNLMDKKSVTTAQTIHSLTQKMIETAIDGDLGVMAVHYEVLLASQVRNINSHLHMPNWEIPNEPYEILTLRQSLVDSPYITTSLLFQYLNKALYYPLTYKKNASSFMDLFFCKRPQDVLSNTVDIVDNSKKAKKISPVIRVHKKNTSK